MRALIVYNYALPHVGGVETLVDQEVRALATAGEHVVLVTSNAGGNWPAPVYPSNVRVERVNAWHGLERWQVPCPLFSPRLITILWRECASCDVMHTHGILSPASAIAVTIAWVRRTRRVLSEHAGAYNTLSRGPRLLAWLVTQTLGRLTARLSSRVVTYSPAVRSFVCRLGADERNTVVLDKLIDTAIYRPPSSIESQRARECLGWEPDRAKVLFVGRLTRDKGVHLLLNALDPVVYDVVFCGPGDHAMLGNLPRPGIEFLPPRRAEDLVATYHAASLLVLPTAREGGLPLVALEALSCGLPVLMTRYEGCEPYQGLPGLTFCEPRAEALQQAIHCILRSPGISKGLTAGLPLVTDPNEWVRGIYGNP